MAERGGGSARRIADDVRRPAAHLIGAKRRAVLTLPVGSLSRKSIAEERLARGPAQPASRRRGGRKWHHVLADCGDGELRGEEISQPRQRAVSGPVRCGNRQVRPARTLSRTTQDTASMAREVQFDEEHELREACGVFGCIASGEWPSNLDVSHIICLGLVALQHR